MGMTEATLKISNPKNPQLSITAKFLVDSGAGFTVIPADLAEKLKLQPVYTKEFSLADGRVVKRKISTALIRFEKEELPSAVVLGEKNDSRLLGALTLESFGLVLDPFERKLYKAKLML